MTRVLGTFGLGGLFLMVSPKLRFSLSASFDFLSVQMDRHQPYSYIGLGVAVLAGVMIFVYQSAQPR
jgi:hypothetical protein